MSFKAEGSKYNNAEDAEEFLQSCIGANYTVKDIQVKPAKRISGCPFYYFYFAAGSKPQTWVMA